jgi:SAM-dependent methyltransferase
MPDEVTYTHGHADSVLRSHRWRTAENSCGYLLDRLAPGLDLLDVGCGPGTITADLAGRVAPGHVVGLDRAGEVLDEARRTAAEAGAGNVELRAGDVLDLPFADGSFDIVHAHQVLQHLADPVAALREMARVCRPGGVVAVRDSDYQAMAWYPESPGLERWLALYRQVATSNGAEPDAGRHLGAWAREAGLTDVRLTASAWCYADEAERAWWSDLWAERTVGTRYGDDAVARGFSTPDELGALAAAWREWGREPDGWFAVLHGELLATIS